MPNSWNHLVIARSGATVTVYINGAADPTTGSNAATLGFNSCTLIIGAEFGANCSDALNTFFTGSVDDVRVYNRVLSVSEIQQLYALGGTTHVNTTVGTQPNLSSGLVGHWTFDGPAMGPNVRDVSGQGKHGNLVHGGSGTTTAPGKIGQSINYGASNDYTSVPSPSLPTGDFTYSIWEYYDGTTGANSLFNAGDGTDALELDILFFNRAIRVITNNTARLTTTNVVPAKEWHHIAVTRSGGAITAYIDGVADPTTGTDAVALSFGSCELLIGAELGSGCNASLTSYWRGRVDDARVYNRALSPAEVTQLYQLGGR